MNNFELIDSIMAKAAPDHALPDHVRREIQGMKKEMLIGILKSAGKYTLFTAIVINLFIFAKKLGLGVSAVKVQIAVKTVLVLTASATAATTGTVVYHQYVKSASGPVKAPAADIAPAAAPAAPVKQEAAISFYMIEIIPFDCAEEGALKPAGLPTVMFNALERRFGGKSAVIADGTGAYRSKYTLRGSCSRLGANYYLSVRLIGTGTSEIVAIINKTASDADDLRKKAGELIDELPELKPQ